MIAFAVAWSLALWLIARNRAPWGDEIHFLETVRQFGRGLSLELLRSYNELSAPLAYVLYAAWGSIAGFETNHLRLLSPLLSSATLMGYWRLLARLGLSPSATVVALTVIAVNPYFVGTSLFVFTDMLALLGMLVAWNGIEAGRPWAASAGIAVASLTRQYSAFLAAALVIAAPLASGDVPRKRVHFAAAAVVGMIPLGALVLLWEGGLSPVNALRARYLASGLQFDPHALSLYVAAPGIYLAPLMLVTLLHAPRRAWFVGLAAAAWLVVFPVQASPAQLQDGITTVGFAHRALVFLGGGRLAHVAFPVTACIAVASVITWMLVDIERRAERGRSVTDWFPWLALACFLVLMPFSFQPWEKYALPEFLICAALFGRFRNGGPSAAGARAARS